VKETEGKGATRAGDPNRENSEQIQRKGEKKRGENFKKKYKKMS